GGTLFLDEIGEMPLELQAKLLRVIQERKFEKVGSSETVSVDVRIIAATNRDLESMIQAGKFRADLYYRLNVLPLNIPPLRQRKDDIEPLAYFFLQKYSSETKKPFVDFSTPAIKALYSYPWPGNVRELENTIERACILGNPPYINLEDFRLNVSFPPVQGQEVDCMQNCVLESLSAEDKSLKNAVNEFKKRYVKAILEQNDWNQTKSAKVLGIQRTYVSKLLTELEIKKQM
ncbi:MAG: sigma-54-dependent Fis family transcriptional regulator, partial [Treponema sp.]|nr:sigma-54-dependent Fis family transcriptional regulator [Treponema sp.]